MREICFIRLGESGLIKAANESARTFLGIVEASGKVLGELQVELGAFAEEARAALRETDTALERDLVVDGPGRELLPLAVRVGRNTQGELWLSWRAYSSGEWAGERFLVESMDGLIVANSDGHFVVVSEYFSKLLGYSVEELKSKPFIELCHPADRERTLAAYASQLERGEPVVNFQNRYVRKDGSLCWLSWRAQSPTKQGLIFAVARDVSEHAETRRWNEVLVNVITRINQSVVVTDSEAHLQWCNQRFTELTGYSFEEFKGHPMSDLQGAETDTEESRRVGELIQRKQPFQTTLKNYTKSGEAFWNRIDAEPMVDDSGGEYYVAIQDNVSDSLANEHALRASEERYRQTIEGFRDAVYILDVHRDQGGEVDDFVFATLNGAALSELSMKREELIGNKICELFPINREAGFFDDYKQVFLTGEPFKREYEVPSDHAAPGFYRQLVVPLTEGVAIFNQDLSEDRARELRQAELARELSSLKKMEALGRLASEIAHDFNNTLAVIMSTSEVLSDDIEGHSEDTDELLADMRQASERSAGFVRKLLEFARPTRGRAVPIDLEAIVLEECRMLERSMSDSVRLGLDLEGGPLIIKAQASQLQQILSNLVKNARDAGASEIRVGLSRAQTDDASARIQLEVRDDGSGMEPEVLDRFFEPFFSTKAEKGTGLGAATVHGIVTSLGGTVGVESAPGQGTVIRMSFEAVEGLPETAETGDWQDSAKDARRVLLVDDDPILVRLVARQLRQQGFEVLATTHPKEALARVREDATIRVAVLDYSMPEMNGLELAQGLKETRPEMHCLVLTGGGFDSVQEDDSVRKVLHKPTTGPALAEQIRAALDET